MSHSRSAPIGKLSSPRLPAIVERSRLYRLLDRARKRPVVWINAPPGFGKTTLVAGYLRARKLRSLWYQVDEGDRDLATFFHYMGLAAQRAVPRYRRPLPHLTPEYLQGLPTFTRRFFEELYQRLRAAGLLVLDNYQEVPSDALFHEMTALGVETISAGMGVMILSRGLPPPAFARLQAAQHMSFLDEEDLRLTKTEAREVVRLHSRSHRQSRPTQIETLHRKLQGWVAGLVLELEQVNAVRAEHAAAAQETPQVIFNYLAREVMQRLSPVARNVLLRTVFLPDMTAAMAERLTGDASAGDILAGLYQSRYFTERRTGSEYLYQYHPLFREFLQAQARAVLHPDQVAEIQHTAAAILEEAGRVEDAVTLYAEAGRIQEIVRVVMARGPELLQQGRTQTLEGWLKLIPAERYEQEPWLSYWLATCRLPVAPVESEAIFEKAFELFRTQGNRAGQLLTLAGIISSMQFSWFDISRFDPWIDVLLDMLHTDASFPSKEIEIQVTFAMVTGLMYRRPTYELVQPWISRAKNLLEGTSDIERYSPLSAAMAHLFSWMGDLASADKYSNILRTVAESETVSPLTRVIHYANRVVLGWQKGDLQDTMTLVEQGLAISQKTGVHAMDSALLGCGFYSSVLQGDLVRAEMYLAKTAPYVTQSSHLMRANFLLQQAWLFRLKGDLAKAWALIQEGLEVKGLKGTPFPESLLSYAAAELLHGIGDEGQADQYLESVRVVAYQMKSSMVQFIGILLKCQFQFDRGLEVAGERTLREAFIIGRKNGFSFTCWWIPTTMTRLCAKALEANIEVDYVRNLIRKTRLVPNADTSANEAWPWPVKIYTLGRFEILLDGKPLPPRRKAPYQILRLLKAIVALGSEAVPASRLIDTLWPDAEGDTGQENLHKSLQRLRRLLAIDDLIQVREGKVSLNRQICWVDALAFRRC